MIVITKEERNAIAAAYPGVHIIRTCRNKSSRGKYYCPEDSFILRFLDKFKKGEVNVKALANNKNSKRNMTGGVGY